MLTKINKESQSKLDTAMNENEALRRDRVLLK